jgi:hypothetical protein
MSTVEAVSLAALAGTNVEPNTAAVDVAADRRYRPGTGGGNGGTEDPSVPGVDGYGLFGRCVRAGQRSVTCTGHMRGRTGGSRALRIVVYIRVRSSSSALSATAATSSVSRAHTRLHRHTHRDSRAGGDDRRPQRRAPLRACAPPVGLEPAPGRGGRGAGGRARELAHSASAVRCYYSSARALLRSALHLMTGGDELASEMARLGLVRVLANGKWEGGKERVDFGKLKRADSW